MLHANDALISFVVNVPEYIQVIDLAGCGFFPARVVAHLEISDLFPGEVNIRDQVALRDLLVVQVIQDFARRAIHGLAYGVGL